jgi:acyl-CoA synthetase (NDP forming)
VPLAHISGATRERLAAVLDPGLPPVNPLDAWGTGADYERVFMESLDALASDAATGAVAMAVDLSGEDLEEGYASVAEETAKRTEKPFAMVCNLPSAIDRRASARLRASGVPVLEGTGPALAAFRGLFSLRDARAAPPPERSDPVDADVRERWRARLDTEQPWSELEALALLANYGIPVVRARAVSNADEAAVAAEALGWPVVLKTAALGFTHKSDVGGVVLYLRDRAAVLAAYHDLEPRLGPHALVAESAPPGVELALGIVRDPQFGALVMVAAGGVLVEVIGDRLFALPPVDEMRARRLLDRLMVRRLLDGVRGSPPVDIDAITAALVRLSELALDLGDGVEALDINPLIAGPAGCMAVDALVVPR